MTQLEKLSQREADVAELLLQGKSNKQIASALDIAVRTVEFHLSSIYSKLGVASRTEAALKLANALLRESTGNDLREAVIDGLAKTPDNGGKTISRRLPVKKLLLVISGALLTTALIATLALANANSKNDEVAPTSLSYISTQITSTPTQPLATSTDPILEQIYQLADEYDQAVQAEKKNGVVEFNEDSTTGDETFFFKGQSYIRISELFELLLEQNTNLGVFAYPLRRVYSRGELCCCLFLI